MLPLAAKAMCRAVRTFGGGIFRYKKVLLQASGSECCPAPLDFEKVTIGSKDDPPGTLFAVYAVLVDDANNQQLAQDHFAGGVATLPSNFEKVAQIEVERGSDSTECR